MQDWGGRNPPPHHPGEEPQQADCCITREKGASTHIYWFYCVTNNLYYKLGDLDYCDWTNGGWCIFEASIRPNIKGNNMQGMFFWAPVHETMYVTILMSIFPATAQAELASAQPGSGGGHLEINSCPDQESGWLNALCSVISPFPKESQPHLTAPHRLSPSSIAPRS